MTVETFIFISECEGDGWWGKCSQKENTGTNFASPTSVSKSDTEQN